MDKFGALLCMDGFQADGDGVSLVCRALTVLWPGASAVNAMHRVVCCLFLGCCGLVGRALKFRPYNPGHRRPGDELREAHKAALIPATPRKANTPMDAHVQQGSAVQGEAPDQHQVGRQQTLIIAQPRPWHLPRYGSRGADSDICVQQPCQTACMNSQPTQHTQPCC